MLAEPPKAASAVHTHLLHAHELAETPFEFMTSAKHPSKFSPAKLQKKGNYKIT